MEGKKAVMKLRGKMAKLMVQTAPEICRKHVIVENGKVFSNAKLLKAFCGTLKAAPLFCKKLVKDLRSTGFKVNPHDPCAANKMTNGKQMTVAWHVDNLKVSHEDANEATRFVGWLKTKCKDKNIGIMKATRGKVHKRLGMTLDF